MKKKKYSLGGELFATGAQFIPGIGQIISPMIQAADQYSEKQTEQYLQQRQRSAIPVNQNIFGKMFGGPILPMSQESTAIKPIVIKSQTIKTGYNPGLNYPNSQQQATEMGLAGDFMRISAFNKSDESTRIAPKFRFREKAFGGFVNDSFKQYDTGSHASGNDQNVDANGNPSGNAQASVQNKENSFKVGGKQFVMSDVLINPETGNTFNVDAAKVNSKFKNARFQPDQRNSLNLAMSRLALSNEKQKSEQSVQLRQGGFPGNPFGSLSGNDPMANNTFNPLGDISPIKAEFANNYAEDPTDLNSLSNNESPKKREIRFAKDLFGGLALGSKALALGQLVSDAIAPAEKESLIQPDYSKSNTYLRGANIDYSQSKQDAIGASNMLSNVNRSMSTNASQFQGRQSMRVAQLQDVLGRINEAQSNAQSQLRMNVGQIENNRALDTANRQYQNRVDNMQNQANSRLADRVLASNLSQIGTELSNYSSQQAEMKNRSEIAKLNTQQAVQYLNAKYPGVSIDPAKVDQFRKGEITLDQLLKVNV